MIIQVFHRANVLSSFVVEICGCYIHENFQRLKQNSLNWPTNGVFLLYHRGPTVLSTFVEEPMSFEYKVDNGIKCRKSLVTSILVAMARS